MLTNFSRVLVDYHVGVKYSRVLIPASIRTLEYLVGVGTSNLNQLYISSE